MIGRSPATTVDTVMSFGRSRSSAPSMTASRRSCLVIWPPRSAVFCSKRFVEVNDHHDRGLDGRPEERDEADPDGDGKVVVQQPEQVDAAGERKGDGQQHVRRLDG